MQKAGFRRFTILLLLFCFFSIKTIFAQFEADSAFTWTLNQVTNPTIQSSLTFTPNASIPSTTSVEWNFGDGSATTNIFSPTHTFDLTVQDTFEVTLKNTITLISTKRKIPISPAFFRIYPDTTLKGLASYSWIFRSFYNVSENPIPGSISKMRFKWYVNDTLIVDPAVNNWPNVYFTFKHGGVNTIKLTIWNNDLPADSISFSRATPPIQPIFGTTKEIIQNIPNVFTPNGDRIHDFFEVTTSGASRLKFMVYSRTGALIYEQEANVLRWDGTNLNGKDLPEGIYYYIIEDLDGKYENAKGFVYIFRGK